MTIKDLKELITRPNDDTKVYIVDLYGVSILTKDKKYVTYEDFLDDKENENLVLIETEAIDFYLFEGKEMHIDIFVDTRTEQRKEELL